MQEYIKLTQPVVDIVLAAAKIKFGEHTDAYNIVMSTVLTAQAEKDTKKLIDMLDDATMFFRYLTQNTRERLLKELGTKNI